ncbi:GtrA family protein [Chondrinema litorale]|uniref:GtrA family protein n=1 Tax=Chondrinema litorale TaxID=2994555 RepID=UPI0025427EAC|nr:GtrA family protein [Chondrinema litorale]UZS00172.1 GtrA family protein [Chondrinema litorale]
MLKLLNSINSKYIELLKYLGIYDLINLLYGKYGQVIKFIIAGGTGAVIELGLFILFTGLLSIHYLLSNLIAISIAILVNYIISQKWVFESGRHSKEVELVVFIMLSVVIILLNQLLMWSFVDGLGFNEKISKVSSIALVAIINFFAKKFLVFKK